MLAGPMSRRRRREFRQEVAGWIMWVLLWSVVGYAMAHMAD